MAEAIFKPEHGQFQYPESALITFNDFGTTVRGDHGREAQYYANQLGLMVIAVDRPGSTRTPETLSQQAALGSGSGYRAEMTRIAQESINPKLRGIKACVVAGHGAGGLGAIALTSTEAVHNQVGMYAAEPAALVRFLGGSNSPFDPQGDAERYYRRQTRPIKAARDESRTEQVVKAPLRWHRDRQAVKNDWEHMNNALATAIGLEILPNVGRNYDVAVLIECELGSKIIEENSADLNRWSAERESNNGMPLVYDGVANIKASKLRTPAVFVQRIAPFLDTLLPKEDLPENV